MIVASSRLPRSVSRPLRRPRRGSALITAIICLTVVGIVAAVSTEFTMPHARESRDRLRTARALALAEAGGAHALALLRGPLARVSINRVLLGPDSVSGTADDGILTGLGIPVADGLPAAGITLSTGSYTVRVLDDPADPSAGAFTDGNNRLVARCRGTTTDGGVAEVDILLGGGAGPAVLFNGPARVFGNPSVTGSCGSLHANGSITATGSPSATGTVSSTGTVSGSGASRLTTANGAAPVTPPNLMAASACKPTDLVLSADGTARLGSVTWTATSTRRWGWRRVSTSPLTWDFDDRSSTPAVVSGLGVCATGNVKVGSNIGSRTAPWVMSVYATGSIDLQGNPFLRSATPDGWLFVAEGDVNVPATSTLTGSVYARGHCSVTGNGSIVGQVVCLSEADGTGDLNLTNENVLSGNGSVTFNCTGPASGTARLLGWMQRL